MSYLATLTRPSVVARGATADKSGTLSHPTGEGWGEGRCGVPANFSVTANGPNERE